MFSRVARLFLICTVLALCAAASAAAQSPDWGPDGDVDGDGVTNQYDRCPGEDPGPVGADGCHASVDRDGDGVPDSEDECPDEPIGDYEGKQGCPFRPRELGPETPPAAGASCAKSDDCLVLEGKALAELTDGMGPFDPDGTITVRVARDAKGNPTRVVDIVLSKVNLTCTGAPQQGPDGPEDTYVVITPGDEVSTTLAPLAIKKTHYHDSDFDYDEFRFDPMAPVRVIAGRKYELGIYLSSANGGREWLSIDTPFQGTGSCDLKIQTDLKRVAPAGVKPTARAKARQKAVAKCKRMPKATKKQRRKRTSCLAKARRTGR